MMGFSQKTLRSLAGAGLFPLLCGVGAAASNPKRGIETSITTVYIVSHPHLDIGYTNPPQVVEKEYKTRIDNEVAFVKAHPGYKWNIEETWQLRQWLTRSSTAEIDELMGLIRAGRIGLGGGHSTLHSSKAGIEELGRFLYEAEGLRRDFNIPIQTVLHNDSPGVPWSYPQILSKGGIRYLVVGMNLFINGGFDAPYHPYLFNWEGPDGSRILTWVTWTGYYETTGHYGFKRRGPTGIDKDKLAKALGDIMASGYPYDALMIQCSEDNNVNPELAHRIWEVASRWNREEGHPRFVMARPEDFFTHVLASKPDIPVIKGSWDSPWDTLQMVEPQTEKTVKNAQNRLPGAEKAWSLAAALGSAGYPAADFARAWDELLVVDEHTGADGVAKWGGATQAETDDTGRYFWDINLDVAKTMDATAKSGMDALAAHAIAPEPSVVVFNPLSWPRGGTVEVALPEALGRGGVEVVDAVSSQTVVSQVVVADGRAKLVFEADAIPSLGLKRYALRSAGKAAAAPPKPAAAAGRVQENAFFRVEAAPDGAIASIRDKVAGRELVSTGSLAFGSLVERLNAQFFHGDDGRRIDVPAGGGVTFATGAAALGSRSLVIRRPGSALPETEIILRDGQPQIEIVETVDRDHMATATLADNSLIYSFAFPFNLPGAVRRLDTPAGWLDTTKDYVNGSYLPKANLHHVANLALPGYRLNFASPDVNTVELRPAAPLSHESTQTTILSVFHRKIDEVSLTSGTIGQSRAEHWGNARWTIRYAIEPRSGAFDPVADDRFGWEACTPLMATVAGHPSGSGGTALALDRPVSLLSVDAPNVVVFDLKRAERGDRFIVKLHEMAGKSATTTLSSQVLDIVKAAPTDLVERNLPRGTKAGGITLRDGTATVALGPNETACYRVDFAPKRGSTSEGGVTAAGRLHETARRKGPNRPPR